VSRVGIITGLLVESKALHRAENRLPSYETPLLCAVAGDAARAYAQACAMADRGVSGLVSFGMAGGLDPALQPGDLIIAESVMDASGKSSNTDSDWRETCKSSINTARSGVIFGADRALCSIADKQAAFSTHHACAVDMESHAVARAARDRNLPFLIVRAIADTAATALPKAAHNAIGPNGERRALSVMAGLLRRPYELPAILRLAQESGAAMKTLNQIAPALLKTTPGGV
jgi:adenosylhomocysteine nucleosidase